VTQGLAGAGQSADCCADEKAHLDHCAVIQGPEMVLNETDFDWSLDLVGEDQANKPAMLTYHQDTGRGSSARTCPPLRRGLLRACLTWLMDGFPHDRHSW
jgi:hypothetical protein